MTATLHGKDYRARTRLYSRDSVLLADVGQTCEHVPASSLPWLLESGEIEIAVERRATTPAATETPNRRKARR